MLATAVSSATEPRIAAIEAGGTKCVCALATQSGEILEQALVPTTDADATFAEMRAFFDAAAERSGPIGAMGIASFGPIELNPQSEAHGRFLNTPKPGWSGASFLEAFSELNVPVQLDTDVNGAALGEYLQGAGQGCRTLAYVTVGTGIGGGILQDGVALRGAGHYEMGHIPVRRNASDDVFLGSCPFHVDCLEGLASGPAIEKRWGQDLSSSASNALALEAFYLGQLAAVITLMHMPDRIIFGGGVMKTPGLLAALRQQTRKRLAHYLSPSHPTHLLADFIVPPALGDHAGITGALELARRVLGASADKT